MKILHVIDTFTDCDNVRQLQTLVPAMRCDAPVEICCLGPETPAAHSLRLAGLIVHALECKRWFNPAAWLHLRAIMRESAPDVVHVWGLAALRTLGLVAPDWLPRIVVSGDLPAANSIPWWDRGLLGRTGCLAVGGDSERRRLANAGIDAPRIHVMPPPLALNSHGVTQFCEPAMRIGCAHESYRHAIWAFDFVRMLYPDATLLLLGAVAQQTDLLRVATGLDCEAAVQFLDPRADMPQILDHADIVWVPTTTDHGRHTALEAMARGKPVIASDVPCLREIIDHGVTGYLVAPGDVVQLARRTRMLIDDPALRTRAGMAARMSIEQRFSLPRTIECWHALYRQVAA